MAKSEWKDDGRKCVACGGSSRAEPLFRFAAAAHYATPMDMHATCVGGYLTSNPNTSLRFAPGIVEAAKPAAPAPGLDL